MGRFKLLLLIFVASASVVSEARTFTVLTPGDSITQGLYRTFSGSTSGVTSPQFGSTIGGYQPYAKSQFNANNEDSIVLYNWGFAGANSVQGIDIVEDALASRFAHFIFINFGANDLYQGVGSSSTAFNLSVMADKAIDDQVVPIIGTITPNTNTEGVGGLNSAIAGSYNPKIISMAASKIFSVPDRIESEPLINEQTATPLADHWNAMNPTWNSLHSGDGLHLNSAGNQKMASEWVEKLENYLGGLELVPPPLVVTPYIAPLLLE